MRRIMILAALLALAVGAPAAEAQAEQDDRGVRFYGLGPRVGFSMDPDQFVFGGHLDFGDPFPHVTWIIPVVEIGIGDDQTVTSLGTMLYYRLYDRWGQWTPLVGAELDVFITSADLPGGESDTDTELGLMGVIGMEKGLGENRFGLELKFRLVDSPDLKFMASWTFGH